MIYIERPEFFGEVYPNGYGFTGYWSVRAGNVALADGAIHSFSEGGARHHVSYEARVRGFVWKE